MNKEYTKTDILKAADMMRKTNKEMVTQFENMIKDFESAYDIRRRGRPKGYSPKRTAKAGTASRR